MPPHTPPLLRDHVAALTGGPGADEPGLAGLAAATARLTTADLERVDRDARRLLADDGVGYARPGGPPGPWRLDPLPYVVPARTWAGLERGLVQRAELLAAVLADLHGPQRLLAEGVVPPAAVLRHPGLLRPLAPDAGAAPRSTTRRSTTRRSTTRRSS